MKREKKKTISNSKTSRGRNLPLPEALCLKTGLKNNLFDKKSDYEKIISIFGRGSVYANYRKKKTKYHLRSEMKSIGNPIGEPILLDTKPMTSKKLDLFFGSQIPCCFEKNFDHECSVCKDLWHDKCILRKNMRPWNNKNCPSCSFQDYRPLKKKD